MVIVSLVHDVVWGETIEFGGNNEFIVDSKFVLDGGFVTFAFKCWEWIFFCVFVASFLWYGNVHH